MEFILVMVQKLQPMEEVIHPALVLVAVLITYKVVMMQAIIITHRISLSKAVTRLSLRLETRQQICPVSDADVTLLAL